MNRILREICDRWFDHKSELPFLPEFDIYSTKWNPVDTAAVAPDHGAIPCHHCPHVPFLPIPTTLRQLRHRCCLSARTKPDQLRDVWRWVSIPQQV